MSTLSRDDIAHLGRLARLELTQEEQDRYASQLSSVVSYIDQLSEVETSGVNASAGVTGLETVLSADETWKDDDLCVVSRESLLAGAPAHDEQFMLVKAVMSDGEGGA